MPPDDLDRHFGRHGWQIRSPQSPEEAVLGGYSDRAFQLDLL